MTKAYLIATILLAMPLCAPQTSAQQSANRVQETQKPQIESVESSVLEGVIGVIDFAGLRRIPATTLRAKMSSKIGEAVNASKIGRDVRVLEAMGWFDSVSVELEELPVLLAQANVAVRDSELSGAPALLQRAPVMRLIFKVEERPFLAKVEFRGGQLLTQERIREILAARNVALKLAAPCNPTELWRAAVVLEKELEELGHPQAKVRVRLKDVPTAAVRASFLIEEGPRVKVERVQFAGNKAFSERTLQKQMKGVTPDAMFAGWRGKDIYTRERVEKDLERVRQFYSNHGFAEAQTGEAQVEFTERRVRKWWPWPGRTTRQVIHVKIPIQEGAAYQLEHAGVEGAISALPEKVSSFIAQLKAPATYSEERILRMKQELAHLEAAAQAHKGKPKVEVEATSQIDREARVIRVHFRVCEATPILVRRIEFSGHKRFSDRYFRRKIRLKEGEEFDAEKLERGLEQLARGGFVRPAKKEDLKIKLDEVGRRADVNIRVEEIGRQRISLTGGGIGMGSSLGIAYNVFSLLGGEELLAAHIEGGPESLQLLLGLAKESVFGTRASLGLSLFRNVMQPRLQGRGRLFRLRSTGLSAAWNHPLTTQDTISVNYEISKNKMSVPLQFPVLLPALEIHDVRSSSTRSEIGLKLTREAPTRSVEASAHVAGGWLGASEQSLHTSLTAARLYPDPLSGGRNAWAFRGLLSGNSSFGGAALPFNARSFAGEELLRGFRRGELGPTVLTTREDASGATVYGTEAGGANAAVAINGEYRVPLESHMEVAAFFDAGSAWLVPRWLGGAQPTILPGTNGIIRGSAGVEARLRLPVINQTVRVNYAVNPWRLAQAILLPDGGSSRPADRGTAFGWALGALF